MKKLAAKVSRKNKDLYLNDLGRFYGCLTKESYLSIYTATQAAYLLSEFRSPLRDYEPYLCQYCKDYHIGRINRNKRKHAKL